MAPSKRRGASVVSRPASADASSGVQTRRSASVQCDLLGSNVDLNVEEPEVLLCPITRTVFRNPVVLFESGHTYERSAIYRTLVQRGQGPAHASR